MQIIFVTFVFPCTHFVIIWFIIPKTIDKSRCIKPLEVVRKGPQIRPNRMKATGKAPSSEELSTVKHKKKVPFWKHLIEMAMANSKLYRMIEENRKLTFYASRKI